MVMRFAAKKNAGCPKALCDFQPREKRHSPPPVGLSCDFSPPPPESVRTDGRTNGRTLTSQPKSLESIDYQIFLAMVLRWPASARAPLTIINKIIIQQ